VLYPEYHTFETTNSFTLNTILMKNFSLTVLGFLLSLLSSTLSAQTSIGGYNVYYGHLHNHCAYSDGTGTPAIAYTYARDIGKLDFFSLADHEYSLSQAEYTQMKKTADSINQDGVFTAFYGFEWSHSTIGHVAVIGSSDYCLSGSSPTNTFTGLVNWLSSHDCIAFFNHPGRQNSTGIEFSHFTTAPSDKFVGMELWNKTDRFEDYYYTDGYYSGDGNLGFYDEALIRNWRIGAAGSEDNHSTNWGNMTPSKLAVLAPAKTRTDIMNALKARRFYSTYDNTLALSFKIGGNEMGSVITGETYTLQIQASDAVGDNFSQVQLLKNGMVVNTWTPGTNTINISQNITCFDGEYYYVRLKQSDNDEVVSSPIWIQGGTANNPPSINLISPVNNTVLASPAMISLTADASDSDGTVSKVAFYQGNTLLNEDLTAPYSFAWNNVAAGVYLITAVATDNLGSSKVSAPVTVVVYNPDGINTRMATIATGSDDAEESAAGAMYLSSTDLELVYDSYNSAGNQTVGLRFTGLYLPQGASITSAYVQFTCDEATTAACNLVIKGEAADHSDQVTSSANNLSGRAATNASVSWVPAAWSAAGESAANQRTPDLSAIIQEIVNRQGFTPSSALMVLITGSGTRTAEAFEGAPASAAKLVVEYTIDQPVVPVFDPIGPLMQGSQAPALPSVSKNGITGIWNPDVISTEIPGTFIFTFTPDEGQTALTATIAISILPAPKTITIGISAGSDDAEEYNSGTMLLNSTDIDMVYDSKTTGNQKVGLRFNQVALPKGATVTKAYLQFTVFGKTTATTSLSIYGHDTDNASVFTTAKKNISGRVKTTALVKWIPAGWPTIGAAGADQQTPDIKSVVQEIIDRTGWKSGNSMAFIIMGTGNRSAVAFDSSAANAAKLVIEYTEPVLKSGRFVIENEDNELNSSPLPGTLTCYPVPFADAVNISLETSGDERIQSISIFNTSGHLLKFTETERKHTVLNTSDYLPGIYLVRVLTDQGTYVKKIIKY
jgi:hypothetical protein